jgi:hypothetical protein
VWFKGMCVVEFFRSYHFAFPLCIMKCVITYIIFHASAILEIPRCLRIWNDPILDKSIYKKELSREWSSQHLPHCGWYLNFPNDYTPSFEISLRERFDVRFMEKFIIVKVDSKWGF